MWKLVLLALFTVPLRANAETVFVKYRGSVDLAPFQCEPVTRSSFIQRVCYDRHERYMLISLNGTYYHYCQIGEETVSGLMSADSMGRYYNRYIKGNFDCRVNAMPSYERHGLKADGAEYS